MSTAAISLRSELRPADARAVAHMVRETGFFSEDEIAIAVELVQETLDKGAASGYACLLGEQGGELLGYSCFGEVPGTRGSFDLYWIVVAPAWQRQGVGRLLLTASEQAVHVYIETSSRDQYAPTRTFYRRNGYAEVARLEDFYAPGDGKLIYVKRLGATAF
jgi:ribosomal protein S18 acetylase RimI-like enzyme